MHPSSSLLKNFNCVAAACVFLSSQLSSHGFARADNPFVQTFYTADPAPLVYNDRVYAFLDRDNDGAKNFDMTEWRLFSTADMANWQDHGTVASLKTFAWSNLNAWAPQVIERNGKFYMYAPCRHNTGQMAIGVAVSNNVTGPFIDALGKPLVENGEIDPTVWIDDDGQAYLYWGNPDLWYVKLNADMITYSGTPVKTSLTVAGFGPRTKTSTTRTTGFEEAPWVYKRNGTYYMTYAANCCSEDIRYSTAPTITGPWTYRGVIMDTAGSSFTNHQAIIDFKGSSYFFYHNGALPGGSGYQRSACVERFVYNSDGTIPTIKMTTAGPPQVGTLDPYVRQEAETAAWSYGVETEVCSEGGMDVTSIDNGDYVKVKGVAFRTGTQTFSARVAAAAEGGVIHVRLGSTTGTPGTYIATCNVPATGGSQKWQTVTCPVTKTLSGTPDLYFVFNGSGFSFNWWRFDMTA
ncbi:probable endo-1,4-beta-xylanase [Rhynchosporium graminicola]|uniref:Probable endo-1,4-beta-xylanase n=1 Tax=Rhynchosporium graminicola TaxID=2792576 RepID=A0A1E1LA55_9HELO|nr:probable endo-1,4-beta-xylanase [Rhynchosporium commune]